ncbi:organic cation transporter protein-like [Schistocerca cancellata]|uniref:organic cation transporter protein-like n=1 Tax=Schistocerca cancellata TaxID=274614 RepID=UPI002118BAE9|nr:organic cation transporter protein-like [Schistocerca cancellata]
MTPEREADGEPVSQLIGDFGRWQLLMTLALALFNVPCTWHIFVPTFQSAHEDFWCAPPPQLADLPVEQWRNLSHLPIPEKGTFDSCHIWDVNYNLSAQEILDELRRPGLTTRPCTEWNFDTSEFGETVISQWSLVCDRAQLTNVAEMTFLTGVAVGGLVSGLVSDKFGRKRTLMVSLALQISVATVMAFSPWFELYVVLRLILGFISVGIVFSGFVLCMELVGGKWRTISGVSYLFPVPVAYIIIAGIAYLVRGWSNLQLAITLPSVILLGLWWVLPESPLWLLALGRKDEVLVILEEAARFNKIELPPRADKILQQGIPQKEGSENASAGCLDLFRTPNLRKNSLVLYVIWFSVYIVYYGLVLNLGNIGGNVYINTVLSGVVELPSIAISILFLLKMGRRWPFCLTLLLSGIACLLTIPVPLDKDLQWVTIALAMAGKFAISSSNVIMPVFTAELFPTVIRNLGVGASNVSAGIALMLVPYLWNLSEMDDRVPMGLLGVCAVVGGLCVLLLPETADRPLPGTLAEGEDNSRRMSTVEKQRTNNSSTGSCNS